MMLAKTKCHMTTRLSALEIELFRVVKTPLVSIRRSKSHIDEASRRDAHAADNKFKLPWLIAVLLSTIIVVFEEIGHLNSVKAIVCPIYPKVDYRRDTDVAFASVHPCELAVALVGQLPAAPPRLVWRRAHMW